MMEPSMCCRLILLGGMLITVAASNFTINSTTTITPRHDNYTNTTANWTRRESYPINVTSTVLPSTNTSGRTGAPANKTTTIHGSIGPTATILKSSSTTGLKQSVTTRQTVTNSTEGNTRFPIKNIAYIIIIIIIIVAVLTIPSFCILKKKKGYNVDNHEDAGVPLSAMDQDASECSSPKEITPELKMFTASETSAEAKGPLSDAVHVAVEDGKGEAGNSVKQGSTSAPAPMDQSEEKLDDIKLGDTDVSNQTSVESLKDLPNENGSSGPGADVPKAEATSAPALSFSEVKLDEPV
ncbi:uncharacterized protein LOC125723324 isoform X2 [Brienomyrus brachyistius]|uniref:uncharacterized protein LOC125723324 isoform X2 n=1 Tax=Brienomyrus brachyistius TaxID=42636 RepID=UPI0020B32D7A|nr:uncharacterized protein LOC125723324 isoform X2 [Brienomyrus brachyistius]